MSKYGVVAIKAVEMSNDGFLPDEAWLHAAKEVFGDSVSSVKKGCPKSAFLGLAEERAIKGIPAGNYTKSKKNKSYALTAFELLKKHPGLTNSKKELWQSSCHSEHKVHNGQMDVVIALWEHSLLNT